MTPPELFCPLLRHTARPAGRKRPAPRLTIAIPAYNRPWLLKDALESIAAQTDLTDIEVIVSDDLGLNAARRAAQAQRAVPVSYLSNPRTLGAVENWNRCLQLARGEWVMILHEDDLLYPWFLSTVLPHLEGDAVAVCTRTTRGPTPPPLAPPAGVAPARDYLPGYFLKSSMSPFPGVVFRRSVALRLGGFDTRWGPVADYEFWYRLACAGRVVVVQRAAAFYRVSHGQWTERTWARMLALSHLLRLRVAGEQFPWARTAATRAARLFTLGNARCYRQRFGDSHPSLTRCLRFGSAWTSLVPSGWAWAALRFASRPSLRHRLLASDARRAPQIQPAGGGPDC